MASNVTLVDPPPTVRTPAWDGTLSTYAAIRDAVPTGPHGRPGFYANMLTASRPGPARLWDGRGWAAVPLGCRVALARDAWPGLECPPPAEEAEGGDGRDGSRDGR